MHRREIPVVSSRRPDIGKQDTSGTFRTAYVSLAFKEAIPSLHRLLEWIQTLDAAGFSFHLLEFQPFMVMFPALRYNVGRSYPRG